MSDITEEDVMKYCYSRNLMLVTKESLEYMHRPIVIETMNKNAIPVEWFKNLIKTVEDSRNYEESEILKWALNKWENQEKENEI